MRHRTSLYIKSEMLQKLNSISKVKNINRNRLILELLHSYASNVCDQIVFNKSIQYQEKAENWARVNICIDINEYEFFLDIRKFMKQSLSFILFSALRAYILNDEGKKIPLRKFFNKDIYGVFLAQDSFGMMSWKIIWSLVKKKQGLRE